MNGDLKVVIHLKEGSAQIGVQQKDTDPVLLRLPESSLEEVLLDVPKVVEQAREKWAASPRNPAGSMPAPPPTPQPPRTTPQRPTKPKEGQMQSMF